MDLPADKDCCATCGNWQGKREWLENGKVCRVSTSTRGRCQKHEKIKPAQGSCPDWQQKDE